ncbi:glycogen synthase GlgA [Thiohalocapsa halophila]|nr:glycogen synthase GlgA [Thiohalocapsa halophila]
MLSDPDPRGYSVLIASSEAHPLVKTGGLGDVAASLPMALRELGHDARLILPAYPSAKKLVRELKPLMELRMPGIVGNVQLHGGLLPDRDLPVYLVDAPAYFSREGNPYTDVSGRDWGDNPERFLLFSRVIAHVAMGLPPLNWRPHVLHCNDWQTGLAPTLISEHHERPATVFTIHNLAYQGLFDRATFERLHLPASLWSVSGLEFHQRMSFIKGGIVFSDRVNTVSPRYADEVRTQRFGCGLDGLLRQLGGRFRGILNGIDYKVWNPADDPALPQTYDAERVHLKAENKLELQTLFGLPRDEHAFVLGHVGRLVEQKGVDLIIDILPRLVMAGRVQLVMQGAGDRALEQALQEAAAAHPERVSVHVGYDEVRAHLVEAGCDAFLMPSRFEPCGLNQMYSLRYGTVPIVHNTGGLADTVVDASDAALAAGTANGFLFNDPNADGLWYAVETALRMHREQPRQWRALMLTGMRKDLSWQASARHYLDFYAEAIAAREHFPQAAMA